MSDFYGEPTQRLVDLFAKSVNTLRKLLVEEFGMQRLYERFILLHGQDITVDNATRMMIRTKHMLEGRKLLA